MSPQKILVRGTIHNLSVVKAWLIRERSTEAGVAYTYVFYCSEADEPHENPYGPDGDVLARNEGLTWARGWDTPEANALRSAVALARTAA